MSQEASAGTVEMEVLTAQALELRMGGATYRQIARTLHVSVSTAYRYVMDGLHDVRELQGELAVNVRNLSLSRLDAMLLRLWNDRGKPRTADTILRLMERQAKLVGADAPVRWEGSGPGGGPIPLQGDMDLDKLTTEELRQLEAMVLKAGAPGNGLVPEAIAVSGPLAEVVP
jgi:hypothetical protein